VPSHPTELIWNVADEGNHPNPQNPNPRRRKLERNGIELTFLFVFRISPWLIGTRRLLTAPIGEWEFGEFRVAPIRLDHRMRHGGLVLYPVEETGGVMGAGCSYGRLEGGSWIEETEPF